MGFLQRNNLGPSPELRRTNMVFCHTVLWVNLKSLLKTVALNFMENRPVNFNSTSRAKIIKFYRKSPR